MELLVVYEVNIVTASIVTGGSAASLAERLRLAEEAPIRLEAAPP